MVPIVSSAWKSPAIIGGSCSATAFASAGDFKGNASVKWLWFVTRNLLHVRRCASKDIV